MLNLDIKDQAIASLNESIKNYEAAIDQVKELSIELYNYRIAASTNVIQVVENYVSKLANTPKEFNKEFIEIKAVFSDFTNEVHRLEQESIDMTLKASSVTGAGAAMGAGVAVLGPTAMMAIATTFGTASTGAAIGSLSGAAATNAALAWIGGGALATGGSGMAGGALF